MNFFFPSVILEILNCGQHIALPRFLTQMIESVNQLIMVHFPAPYATHTRNNDVVKFSFDHFYLLLPYNTLP